MKKKLPLNVRLLSNRQRHERNFTVDFIAILCNNLENDDLLMIRDGLLADGLDEFAQSGIMLAAVYLDG
jgi:hypothetical protein